MFTVLGIGNYGRKPPALPCASKLSFNHWNNKEQRQAANYKCIVSPVANFVFLVYSSNRTRLTAIPPN